eukprot:TRINITY_DN4106_c0_g1_i1.p1 TRINITY_DN4106_c0_g1~~TRINITY_DN4106_c0_g1_i1.p1  ORF type:complete len:867 (+),score=148.26 TRINITY_DN4106_c0_g1_i1:23-2602(+)
MPASVCDGEDRLRESRDDFSRKAFDPGPAGLTSDRRSSLVKRAAVLNLPPLGSSRRDNASFEPVSGALSPRVFRRSSDSYQLYNSDASSNTRLPALSQSPRASEVLSQSPRPMRMDAARRTLHAIPDLSQSPWPRDEDKGRFVSSPSPDLSQSQGPTCKDTTRLLTQTEPLPDRRPGIASPRARKLNSSKFSSEPVKRPAPAAPEIKDERLPWDGPRRMSLPGQPRIFESGSEDVAAPPSPRRRTECFGSRRGSDLWANVRRAWQGKSRDDEGLVSDLLRTHMGNQQSEMQDETGSDLAQALKWLREEWGSETVSPEAIAALTSACGGVSASSQIEALTLKHEVCSSGLRGFDALSHVLRSKHGDIQTSFRWFNCFGSGMISRSVFDTGLLLLHVDVDDLTGMRNQDLFEQIARPGRAYFTLDDWNRAFEPDGARSESGQAAARLRREFWKDGSESSSGDEDCGRFGKELEAKEHEARKNASEYGSFAKDLEAKEHEARKNAVDYGSLAKELEAKEHEANRHAAECDSLAKELEAKEHEARKHVDEEREVKEREAREREAKKRETEVCEAKQPKAKEHEARERELEKYEAQECEEREREVEEWQAREQEAREKECEEREIMEREIKRCEARDREAREKEQQVQEAKEHEAKEREAMEWATKECEARERDANEKGRRAREANEHGAAEGEALLSAAKTSKNSRVQSPVVQVLDASKGVSKLTGGIPMGDAEEDQLCDHIFVQYASKTGILRRPDVTKFTKDAYRVIKRHRPSAKGNAVKESLGGSISSLDFSRQLDRLFDETLDLQVDTHCRYSHGLTQYFFKVFVTKVACCYGWLVGGLLLAFLEDLENSSDTGMLLVA